MGVRNSFTKKEVISALRQLGCIFSRQGKGSHEIRYYPQKDATFVLAFHGNKPMREGTLRGVLEECGINEKDFLKTAGK